MLHTIKDRIKWAMFGLLEKHRRQSTYDMVRAKQSLRFIYDHCDIRGYLPPLTNWPASADTMALVVELIRRHNPMRIIEIGSGASTVVIGSYLRRSKKPRFIFDSIEDGLIFYRETIKLLSSNHLSDSYAKVYHCPIVDGWYDLSIDESNTWLDGKKYDFVFIDGPSNEIGPQARYPAIDQLEPYLKSNAVILLDDAHRDDEKKVIERWQNNYKVTLNKIHDTCSGLAELSFYG